MRLIDADELKRRGCKSCGITHKECIAYMGDVCFLREIADETPTLDVQPVVHAKWKLEKYLGLDIIYCENCNNSINCNQFGEYYLSKWKFCPHCGAIMDEKEVK